MRAAEDRLSPGDLLLCLDGLVEQPDRRTAEPVGLETVRKIVGSAEGRPARYLRGACRTS